MPHCFFRGYCNCACSSWQLWLRWRCRGLPVAAYSMWKTSFAAVSHWSLSNRRNHLTDVTSSERSKCSESLPKENEFERMNGRLSQGSPVILFFFLGGDTRPLGLEKKHVVYVALLGSLPKLPVPTTLGDSLDPPDFFKKSCDSKRRATEDSEGDAFSEPVAI